MTEPNTPTVEVSEELIAPVGSGIELCYQTFGSPNDEPLLLIMGLGGPMTWWDPGLCALLAEAGFYVVRFDNRDIGRSSRATGRVTAATLVRAFFGLRVTPPYTLSDMATDAIGLLDHLGLASAHLCGVSMGGMIAQTLSIEHPDRVRSLVSIMSTTGQRTVGYQHPTLLPSLLSKSAGKEAYVASAVRIWKMIDSPAYPSTEEQTRQRASDTFDRGVSAAGVARQMLAVETQPNRTKDLRNVTVPTTVIHGLADKMVHVSGGRATSMAVPGSELLLVAGMGHDLPEQLWPRYVRAIRRTADRAARIRWSSRSSVE